MCGYLVVLSRGSFQDIPGTQSRKGPDQAQSNLWLHLEVRALGLAVPYKAGTCQCTVCGVTNRSKI